MTVFLLWGKYGIQAQRPYFSESQDDSQLFLYIVSQDDSRKTLFL